MKEHLIDELDYVLVPTEAWNKLVSWYGCLEGQKPIVRKVMLLNACFFSPSSLFVVVFLPFTYVLGSHINIFSFFRLSNMACLSSTVRWKSICWS